MSGNGNGSKILQRLLNEGPRWARELGPQSTVILSSRVRLARNLNAVPFPARGSEEDQAGVVRRVCRAAAEVPGLIDAEYIAFEQRDPADLAFLVERRLVSRDLIAGHRPRGVLVVPGEETAVLVNEEDHLRLQCVLSGLRLGEAFDHMNGIDTRFDAGLDYAYSDEFGFLTACPTNVGTGMRASVLAHLPALVLTQRAKKVIQGVTAMGLAVRGFYGEGTEIMGNFFQISNQTTLGEGENKIISRLDEVVRQIIGYEEEARGHMWASARVQIEDKVYRAYGTLLQARSISAEEVVSLASAVRFGIALELPKLCPLNNLNEILISAQPGHVSGRAGRKLEKEERRERRATQVRSILSGAEGEPSSGS